MPGPSTEVLNDDLKEIRADLHRMEVSLTTAIHQGDAGLATEINKVNANLSAEINKMSTSLSAEINKVNTNLTAEIGRVNTNLSAEINKVNTNLSAEINKVNTNLSAEINKVNTTVDKLGAEFALFKWLLGLTLVASLSGVGVSIWWAATVTNRVGTRETKSDQNEVYRKDVNARFDRIDARLERIESSITKAIGRSGAGGASTPEPR